MPIVARIVPWRGPYAGAITRVPQLGEPMLVLEDQTTSWTHTLRVGDGATAGGFEVGDLPTAAINELAADEPLSLGDNQTGASIQLSDSLNFDAGFGAKIWHQSAIRFSLTDAPPRATEFVALFSLYNVTQAAVLAARAGEIFADGQTVQGEHEHRCNFSVHSTTVSNNDVIRLDVNIASPSFISCVLRGTRSHLGYLEGAG